MLTAKGALISKTESDVAASSKQLLWDFRRETLNQRRQQFAAHYRLRGSSVKDAARSMRCKENQFRLGNAASNRCLSRCSSMGFIPGMAALQEMVVITLMSCMQATSSTDSWTKGSCINSMGKAFGSGHCSGSHGY